MERTDPRVEAVLAGRPPPRPTDWRAYFPPAHFTKPLELANPLPDAGRIAFDAPSHTYRFDGELMRTSVTGLIRRVFPEDFNADRVIASMMRSARWTDNAKYKRADGTMMNAQEIKDMWETKRDRAANEGSWKHFLFELLLNGLPTNDEDCEVGMLRDMLATFCVARSLRVRNTELEVCWPSMSVAGSIDALFTNADGSISVFDWKASEKLVDLHAKTLAAATPTEIATARSFSARGHVWPAHVVQRTQSRVRARGREPLEHLPDDTITHYWLQLHLYGEMLRSVYGKTIGVCYIVCLHHTCADGWVVFEAPDLSTEARAVFDDWHASVIEPRAQAADDKDDDAPAPPTTRRRAPPADEPVTSRATMTLGTLAASSLARDANVHT